MTPDLELISKLQDEIAEWRDRVSQLQQYIVSAGLPIPQPNYVFKPPRVCDHDWHLEPGVPVESCRKCWALREDGSTP